MLLSDLAASLDAQGRSDEACVHAQRASDLARQGEHPELHVLLRNLAAVLTHGGAERGAGRAGGRPREGCVALRGAVRPGCSRTHGPVGRDAGEAPSGPAHVPPVVLPCRPIRHIEVETSAVAPYFCGALQVSKCCLTRSLICSSRSSCDRARQLDGRTLPSCSETGNDRALARTTVGEGLSHWSAPGRLREVPGVTGRNEAACHELDWSHRLCFRFTISFRITVKHTFSLLFLLSGLF